MASPAMLEAFGAPAAAGGFPFGAKDLMGMGMNMAKGDQREQQRAPMMMPPQMPPPNVLPFVSLNPYLRQMRRKVY
jgi:hypothetical protein